MSDDMQRLVVSLEAKIDKFDRQMAKANSIAFAKARQIEKTFVAANQNISFSTANIAAQFQDIGVQLAGGQSPFLIALQQGTQLSSALGSGGLRGTLAALAGGFGSLLSPVSLLTIGIIGLGGMAVQQLGDWYSSGELTEAQLKEQAALIRRVADTWGDAIPSIKAYADAVDEAAKKADALAAGQALAREALAPFIPAIDELRGAVEGAIADFIALGATSEDVRPLQEAMAALQTKTLDGTATAHDFKDIQELSANLIAGRVNPTMDRLSEAIAEVAAQYSVAAGKASEFIEQTAAAVAIQKLGPLGTLTPLESGGGKFLNPAEAQDFRARAAKSQTQLAAEKSVGGRNAAAEAAKREAAAVAELISELEFEYSLLAMTAAEKEKARALREAGTAATEAQRAKIVELTSAIYAEKAAQEQAEAATKAHKQAMDELGKIGENALNGLANALQDGKISAEEMIAIVVRLIQQLLMMKGLGAIFGGLGGGSVDPWAGMRGYKDGGFIQRLAGGGKVRGSGGPRDDRVPILASNGEYMVNARSTRENLPLLEAINSGRKFADGGLIALGANLPGVMSRASNIPASQPINAPLTFAPVIQGSGNAASDDRLLGELRKMFEREFTPRTRKALREIKLKSGGRV